MAFNVGNCIVIDNNRNVNAGVGTFTDLNVPPKPSIFSPASGATETNTTLNIVITFNQRVVKGTGNITIRSGSASGTILETLSVDSGRVTTSEAVVTIDPVNNLPFSTNVYVVVDAGAFINSFQNNSVIINTYNFTTRATAALGASFEGGFLICCSSPVFWIVAPSTSEVSRDWFSRDDANTTAQQVSGCTGWFVPTIGQLQNPGCVCRNFWDSFSATYYWSSTEVNGPSANRVFFPGPTPTSTSLKPTVHCVRSFRCVTY